MLIWLQHAIAVITNEIETTKGHQRYLQCNNEAEEETEQLRSDNGIR